MKINLPPDILQKDKIASLPAKGKSEYMYNVLKKILEMNPEGITTSKVVESTGYTYSTVWHHLEMLSATEQCLKKQSGNSDAYFPNHAYLNEKLQSKSPKESFQISSIKNDAGKFIGIHRLREDRQGNMSIASGISIAVDNINEIMSALTKSKKPRPDDDKNAQQGSS